MSCAMTWLVLALLRCRDLDEADLENVLQSWSVQSGEPVDSILSSFQQAVANPDQVGLLLAWHGSVNLGLLIRNCSGDSTCT